MFTRHFLAQVSLGLGFAITFIHPASSQITPNGAGTVVNPQGNQINITGGTQTGANLFHSFRDFNVNSAQVANFLSNPQIQNILARINGGNPSMINGLLQVTGGNSNLFLMNPAGIIFGQGASLNVPASFTATTANQIGFGNNVFNAFGDNNFSALIGNPDSFIFSTPQAGSIVNGGNLAVGNNQNISLIAGNTINTGRLTAPGGEIQVLAVPGTNRVRLSQPGQVLSLEIVPPVDGTLRGVDLPALLTGSDLLGIQVNPSGQVQVAGTTLPNQQGIAVASGRIDVSSATGNGGVVQVMGDRVAVLDARINANGATGGGTVRLGGEYLGGRDTGIAPALRFNSQRTLVDRNSLIRANATNTGEGGRVIVWADQNTGYFGRITGRGATGRGAFVEISGRENLAFDGRVEIPGANGLFGSLLLDPTDIIIQAAVGNGDGLLPTILDTDTPLAMTISAGALAAIAPTTPINIAASNNITFNVPVTFAECITGIFCGAISFTAGGIFNTNGNDITATGRNFRVTAGSITARDINTSSSTTLRDGGSINLTTNNGGISVRDINTGSVVPGAATGNGGRIDLNAVNGNISAREISSRTGTDTSSAGLGGNIVISAPNGNVNVSDVTSMSVVDTNMGTSRNAGTINITAQSIDVSGVIAAYSRVDRGTAGNGGDVTVLATNGSVTASSITSLSGNEEGSTGVGGNITIDATNDININGTDNPFRDFFGIDISVYAIDSRSITRSRGNTGTGGHIRINQNLVSNGNLNIAEGVISSSSNSSIFGVFNPNAFGNSARGGDIFITARNVSVNQIDTRSIWGVGNGGDGGNITINAQNIDVSDRVRGLTVLGSIFSSGDGGGNITLNAQNDLTLSSISSDGVSRNGGSINLTAGLNISASRIRSNSFSGENGGNIRLNARDGNIEILNYISTEGGNAGRGGHLSINAGDLFIVRNINLNPGIVARDGTRASITTQGGAGGGIINITHGGSTTVDFSVGGATDNGTGYAITSGSGSNTINNLVVPVPPAINTYGTNITIRTTTDDTPILPPEPPFPPDPPILSPEPPILPLQPIDPSIFRLLTNPAPPSTPNPVIVGTPPILVVETIPVAPTINPPVNTSSTAINPPINTSSIEQTTVAPTTTNNPTVVVPPIINNPTVVVPPPSPTNPQLSRPILDANPGVQSPLSLTAANSTIPIIDRIPVDSLNNRIRLLDDPFKEEFQAFTGIADEIATLDVNQAQDILNRITRETNAKPVFIYVFFSPANDVNSSTRTVNSARSELFRNPQNTDTLEVVLVPPTGDLIRVKYPGLRRSEVIEIAGAFTRGVARSLVYAGASKRMYDLIIAPLEEDLQRLKIDNLVFLMDAGLRSMPLAAMQNKDNKFIIEDYSVGLMPSLTLTDTIHTSLKDSQVLAMGAERFVSNDLSPLPGVPVELNIINQLRGGNTLLNENFTLNNLRQARRPQQRIVHLATHGSFTSGDKSNSFIQLWGNERLTLDQIRQADWGTPPIDLLVLSACETAQGDRDAELGFAGLAVTSGVRSALASLWLVSDEGTTGLMAEFYQQLQTTTTKSEALRQAQLAMLRGEVRLEAGNLVTPKGNFPLNEELRRLGDKRLTHPYFWSAFTMVGNPW